MGNKKTKQKISNMNKKAVLDPLNLIIGFVALVGAVLIMINRVDYGLVLLIIATLIESMQRLFK